MTVVVGENLGKHIKNKIIADVNAKLIKNQTPGDLRLQIIDKLRNQPNSAYSHLTEQWIGQNKKTIKEITTKWLHTVAPELK